MTDAVYLKLELRKSVPHLDLSLEEARANVRRVNPDLDIIEMSCIAGEGISEFQICLLDLLTRRALYIFTISKDTCPSLYFMGLTPTSIPTFTSSVFTSLASLAKSFKPLPKSTTPIVYGVSSSKPVGA